MVSIVIPSYNTATWVAEAVESALSQTYPARVIVVDDASEDSSLRVLEKYHNRISVISEYPNRGLNATRNIGALYAGKNDLLFLDADDIIASDYLEKTVPLMTPGVGMVSTGMQYFGLSKAYVPPGFGTLTEQKAGNHLPYCSLIRREAFDQVGGYSGHPDIHAYGDWHLSLNFLKAGWAVKCLNEPLFHYRVRKGSMRSTVESQYHVTRHAILQDLFPEEK